jgi:hypothetical protein
LLLFPPMLLSPLVKRFGVAELVLLEVLVVLPSAPM